MPSSARLVLAAAAVLGFASAAEAKVRIQVDLDRQTMHVDANGQSMDWKVSSGKQGYETPNGAYHVLWMDKDHFSDTYDKAPMPNAIFFAPGYAIHGAFKSPWGHRASHGCVRLPPAKAAILFEMVKKQGADITLTGGADASTEVAEKLKRGESTAPTEIAPAAYRNRGNAPEGQGGDPGEPVYEAPPPAQGGGPSIFGQFY